jgi:hypothetical protein
MRVFALAIAICVASAAQVDAAPKPKPRWTPKKPPPKKEPPPTPEKIRADKLFDDGRRYLVSKEYALACTAFEQSQTADPAIGTLLNIALCYETWGKIAASYRWYLEAEKFAREKSDDREKGARAKVDELAPKVPHLQVDIPADADIATTFVLDGKEIDRVALADDQLVEPGRHTIVARVPGKPPKETVIDIKQGERRRLTIDVPRPEVRMIVTGGQRRKGKFYGGIGMIVAGTSALGIAGFVSLVARQDYADALQECPDKACTSREAFDATQSARKKANVMTFVSIGGAALAGVGIYFVLTSRRPKSMERKVTIVPSIEPDAVGVVLRGSL